MTLPQCNKSHHCTLQQSIFVYCGSMLSCKNDHKLVVDIVIFCFSDVCSCRTVSARKNCCIVSVSKLQSFLHFIFFCNFLHCLYMFLFLWCFWLGDGKEHRHLRRSPLWVRSATSRQQPPEWSVLSQVDCFSPREFVWVHVTLNRFHPRYMRSSQKSLPVYRWWRRWS